MDGVYNIFSVVLRMIVLFILIIWTLVMRLLLDKYVIVTGLVFTKSPKMETLKIPEVYYDYV